MDAGAQLSQDELMLKDECILVDEGDNIVGHANKHSCHRFEPGQPKGTWLQAGHMVGADGT
jgi:hypothetical protein